MCAVAVAVVHSSWAIVHGSWFIAGGRVEGDPPPLPPSLRLRRLKKAMADEEGESAKQKAEILKSN